MNRDPSGIDNPAAFDPLVPEVRFLGRDGHLHPLSEREAFRPAPAEQSEACRLREERDRALYDLEAMRVERDAARARIAALGQLAEGMAKEAAGELRTKDARIRMLEVSLGWRRGRVRAALARAWGRVTRSGRR